jgi:hypothetical protein
MRYEESNAAVPRDMMALKATEDPMLINERRETITRLTQRALSGTVKVGLTYIFNSRLVQNNLIKETFSVTAD